MAVATRTVNANASSGTQTGRPCPASPYGYLLLQPTFVVQKRMSIASLKRTDMLLLAVTGLGVPGQLQTARVNL